MKNNAHPAINILLIGVRLLAICAVAGLVLSFINGITEPSISVRQQAEEAAALKELFPGGVIGRKQPVADKNFETVVASYRVSAGDQTAGYILELSGTGYGGHMKIMASYQAGGEVYGVKLMDNEETPGLGKKAEESSYMHKFIGKGGRESQYPVPVSKEMLASQQSAAGGVVVAETGQPRNFFQALAVAFLGEPQAGGTDSVTGATITFTGISQAVAAGSDYVKKIKGGGK